MGKLDGPQITALTDLLTDTLGEFDLEVITHVATGDQLFEAFTSPILPRKRQIRDVLLELEATGTTGRFLGEVWRSRPDRDDVRDAIVTLFPEAPGLDPATGPTLSLQHGGAADPSATQYALAPGLQKNVKPHLSMIDLGIWPDLLVEKRRRVCKVEIDGGGSGTGFLVGPAAVLTNWHVVMDMQGAGQATKIACRFDYQSQTTAANGEGVVVRLGQGGILDQCPCSQAELKTQNPDEPPPGKDELDYALLELAEPVGNNRGFEALPQAAPHLPEGSALLIMQHPNGERAKLALDTEAVIGRVNQNLRLRYKTNTDAGSSGSPCFTMDWGLVALHHLGDPRFGPKFNQGIPIELIRASIVARGHGAAIGAM